MKTITVRQFGATLFLLGSLSFPLAASAHGGEHHEASEAASGQEQVTTVIPATAAEIWTEIDAAVADLDKTVASGALDEVHHYAFAIRDLVVALPEHSKSLPADKLAKVQGSVKFVATLAQRLDTAGDANDMEATQSGITQLKKVLADIRVNY